MHTYIIHACMHAYIHTDIHAYTHTYTHTHIHTHTYTHIYIHIYIHTYNIHTRTYAGGNKENSAVKMSLTFLHVFSVSAEYY